MKLLISLAFIAAAFSGSLSYAGILSATSIVPPVCFAVALVLVLLHMMNVYDRRY